MKKPSPVSFYVCVWTPFETFSHLRLISTCPPRTRTAGALARMATTASVLVRAVPRTSDTSRVKLALPARAAASASASAASSFAVSGSVSFPAPSTTTSDGGRGDGGPHRRSPAAVVVTAAAARLGERSGLAAGRHSGSVPRRRRHPSNGMGTRVGTGADLALPTTTCRAAGSAGSALSAGSAEWSAPEQDREDDGVESVPTTYRFVPALLLCSLGTPKPHLNFNSTP